MSTCRQDAARRAAALRWGLALGAAVVGGCASSGTARPSSPSEAQRVIVGSGHSLHADAEIYRERRSVSAGIAAPPEVVFGALATAYAMVGLQGSGPAIGRQQTWAAQPRVRGRLDKVPLSKYIDCGRTATGEQGADLHMITLTVTSEVTGSGKSSTLATRVLAVARAVDNSNSAFDCSSRGTLETRINEDVASRVQ